jgi:subtilisin family serine protease
MANAADVAVYRWSGYDAPTDVDVQELTDAGVVFVCAAGNFYGKNAQPFDPDYSNYVSCVGYTDKFYHNQGSSPKGNTAIMVGAIDTITSGSLDRKVDFSHTADVYAPGAYIMGACSNTNVRGGVTYAFGNAGYKQAAMSGTSQASPQVAGIIAVYLGRNPGATPANVKAWISGSGAITNVLYNAGNSTNYLDYNALMGGPNKMAYSNIFAPLIQSNVLFSIGSGTIGLQNISLTYT